MKRIRVLMVTPLFPPRYSGSTNQALNLAKHLKARCEISFLALSDEERPPREYAGFPVVYVRAKNIQGVIAGTSAGAAYGLIGKLLLRLFCMRGSFDVLHCHLTAFPFSTLSLCARLLGKPLLMKNSLFGELDWERVGRLSGRLHRMALRSVDRFAAVSDAFQAHLRNIGFPHDRIRYITNGVDCTLFSPLDPGSRPAARQRLGLGGKARIITFVGAICERKGVRDLIRQWPDMLSKLPGSLLLLIGPSARDDPAFSGDAALQTIEEHLDEAEPGGSVRLTGRVDNVHEYLQVSDLLVLPSRNEGMPNVVLEAMACGVPCVVSRVSGVSDIIDPGQDGYILDDVANLGQAVVDHFQRGDIEAVQERVVRKIRYKFSLDVVAAQYLQAYKELLDGNQ